MLMLYRFKVEVFDRVYGHTFLTDYALITESDENRVEQIGKQIAEDRDSVLKRCILLSARALSLRERNLVRESNVRGLSGRLLWLAARRNRSAAVRPTLYVYASEEIAAIDARPPDCLDVFLLSCNRFVPSLSAPERRVAA